MAKVQTDRLRLSDKAYSEIRRLIIECTLKPGATISEPAISQMLGLSKSGVRVALQRLAEENLVIPVPRQGYRVSSLTIKDAKNILQLRLVLEPYAASLAAGKVGIQDFADIRKQFAKGYTTSKPHTITEFIVANKAARVLIARASGNERLAALISNVVDEVERYLRTGYLHSHNRSEEFFEGHKALVSALISGDSAKAETLCRQQLQSSSNMILEALRDRHEILEAPLMLEQATNST